MIDLKKFKKVNADKTHTTFESPDGHIIKVAHKAMSKSMHNELRQLPMNRKKHYAQGGMIEDEIPEPTSELLPAEQGQGWAGYQGKGQNPLSVAGQVFNAEQGFPDGGLDDDAVPVGSPDLNANIVPPPAEEPQREPQAQKMFDAGESYAHGVSDIRKGLMSEAKAEGEAGKAEAAALQQNQEQLAELQQSTQARFQELSAQRAAFAKDIENGHIDPTKYLASLSTGGKIVTAIGLIMGGMGAGLTGKDNPALTFINQQIDRDIEAQKAEMGKKMNLLTANMQEFGNLRDATEMTRIMMNDAASMKLKQAAALSKDPIAQARAMQAAGKLEMDTAPQMQALAMRSSVLNGMKGGKLSPTHAVRYLIEDKADQKAATEEIEMVNGFKAAAQSLNDAFAKAEKIGGISGNIPFTHKKAEVEALRAELVSAVRSSMKGQGALSDQEVKDSVTPLLFTATDTNAQMAVKKKSMLNILSKKVQAGTPMLDRYNIPMDKEAPQFDSAKQRLYNFAKANPKSPQSKQILQSLGVK